MKMFSIQKTIPVLALFITVFSIFNSGCRYPVSLPEVEDEIAEITVEESDTIVESDTVTEATARKPLTLIFTNLDSAKSPVNVVFYQKKHEFLSKTDRLKGYKFKSNGKTLTVQIKDISYGEFAIAFYQDVNNNGICDRNVLGIPKEPYGFSNNFKPKLKPPRFEDSKFNYNEKENTLTLSMIN